jgi:hypothetical protein
VYTNAGDFYQATPGWVYAAGAASYTIEQGHDTPQPVPTDAVFTAKFAAFLAALGARYDGHPDIEFFQTNAGMGAYGEMVWSLDGSSRPPGYSAKAQIQTNREWLDRWRAVFPRTKLVLMQNFIGDGIAENVTAYAVGRGFFLQSNSPGQEDAAAAILRKHDERTKIVLEIENRGCQASTGQAFDGLIDEVFGYGFAIDYLVICGETFDDAEGVLRAYGHLRK